MQAGVGGDVRRQSQQLVGHSTHGKKVAGGQVRAQPGWSAGIQAATHLASISSPSSAEPSPARLLTSLSARMLEGRRGRPLPPAMLPPGLPPPPTPAVPPSSVPLARDVPAAAVACGASGGAKSAALCRSKAVAAPRLPVPLPHSPLPAPLLPSWCCPGVGTLSLTGAPPTPAEAPWPSFRLLQQHRARKCGGA
jgi:hypothetical protein